MSTHTAPPAWTDDESPTATTVPESHRMLYAYRSVVFNGELRDDNGMEIVGSSRMRV